jgi:hypothetical protein
MIEIATRSARLTAAPPDVLDAGKRHSRRRMLRARADKARQLRSLAAARELGTVGHRRGGAAIRQPQFAVGER